MLLRIANREDPDQMKKQSDLGLPCLSRPLLQATTVQNFRRVSICINGVQPSETTLCP